MAAGITVALCAPIVAWDLIGDQSEVAADFPDPDYAYRPFALPGSLGRGIEVAALVLLVAAIALLGYSTARRRMRLRWWWVIGIALGLGLLIGLTARVATARVIGANIGFGLALLVLGPVSLLLGLTACGLTAKWLGAGAKESGGDA